MRWNVDEMKFLYPPDVFTGTFDNAKMQTRHQRQVEIKLETLKSAISRETDPLLAMGMLHKKDHLQFLLNNRDLFQEAGRLEEAVLLLYCRQHGPFLSAGDVTPWSTLFEACDRRRLHGLGDPVNFESATVYRGALMGSRRSLSWSIDRQTAQWYSERWKGPVAGGDIYEVDIAAGDVLIRIRQSREAEVIVDPRFIRTAKIRPFVPVS